MDEQQSVRDGLLIDDVLRDLQMRWPLPARWHETFQSEAAEFLQAIARHRDQFEPRLRAWADTVWRDYRDEVAREAAEAQAALDREAAEERRAAERHAARLGDRRDRNWESARVRSDASQLRIMIEARGVERVFHWTEAGNLESILANGLRSRRWLRGNGIATSLHSYGSPLKERQLDDFVGVTLRPQEGMIRRAENPIVFELEPAVLAIAGALFIPGNSARNDLDLANQRALTSLEAFSDLFEEVNSGRVRDWQAEVWVPGYVSPASIMAVATRREAEHARLSRVWPDLMGERYDLVPLNATTTWNMPEMSISVDDIG